jgi:hypothetical protein
VLPRAHVPPVLGEVRPLSGRLTPSPIFREAESFESTADKGEADKGIKYTVTLLDTEFETSPIFLKVLEAIVHSTLDISSPTPDPQGNNTSRLLRRLCRFTRKWQCTGVERIILKCLYEAVYTMARGPLLAFVFGTVLENDTLRKAMLERYGEWPQSRYLDPAEWPTWAWENCPPSHAAAVVALWINNYRSHWYYPSQFESRVKQFEEESMLDRQ